MKAIFLALRRWAPSAVVVVLLTGLFNPLRLVAAIEQRDQPAAQSAQGQTPPRNDSPSQARWRALVEANNRALVSHQANQTEAAAAFDPILHLNLSTSLLIGHVSRPDRIDIRTLRQGEIVNVTSVQPIFAGTDYLFIADAPVPSGYHTGEVISLTQASQSISLTVPLLTGVADASSDTISGAAPDTASVSVSIEPYTQSAEPQVIITRSVSADASGLFTLTLSGTLNIKPRDGGFVQINLSPRQFVYAQFVAPFLRMEVGGSVLAGQARLNQMIFPVEVLTGSNPLATTPVSLQQTSLGTDDQFYMVLSQPLQSGNVISASIGGQSLSTTVPTLTLQADAAHQNLFGSAPPNARVDLQQFSGPITDDFSSVLGRLQPIAQISTTANAQGSYTATLATAAGDYLYATTTQADGHQAFARLNIPLVRARLGRFTSGYNVLSDYLVSGQLNEFEQPLTVTIQGPSGFLKGTHVTGTQIFGPFMDQIYTGGSLDRLVLDSGDVLTVSTGAGVVSAFKVPTFTVNLDPANMMVSGAAPPNAPIKLIIPSPFGDPYALDSRIATDRSTQRRSMISNAQDLVRSPSSSVTVIVTATASGYFSATLKAYVDPNLPFTGEVELDLGGINRVVRRFWSYGVCKPTVSGITVGGNVLQIANANCASNGFGLRIWSASGAQKYAESNVQGYEIKLFDRVSSDSRPIRLETGDQIEIAQANEIRTRSVPTFSIQLDPTNKRIFGQTLPNREIYITVRDAPLWHLLPTSIMTQTESDAQGHYSLTLGSSITLGHGSSVQASIFEPGLILQADAALPLLQLFAGDRDFSGILPPLSPYTVSAISATDPVSPINPAAFYAGVDGGFSNALTRGVRPGDHIGLDAPTGQIELSVPELDGAVNHSTGEVIGHAPPRSAVRIYQLETQPALPYLNVITPVAKLEADSTGVFRFSLPGTLLAQLPSLTLVMVYEDQSVQVWQQINLGNVHWLVNLTSNQVSGALPSGVNTITLTLRNAQGTLKEQLSEPADGRLLVYSGVFMGQFSQSIQIGDVLQLAYPGAVISYTVPELTARYQALPGVLTGMAPAHIRLEIYVMAAQTPVVGVGQSASRKLNTITQGNYGVDLSDIRPFLGSPIQILLTDADLNQVQMEVTAAGEQTWLPIIWAR